jgi:N-methylhydantoinase B/oxoprolinase/acetone carboxylase alpha subunit
VPGIRRDFRHANGGADLLEDTFRHAIPPGDRLVMLLLGRSGFGPPERRASAALERDMRYGFVSAVATLQDYDCAPDAAARKDDKDPQ